MWQARCWGWGVGPLILFRGKLVVKLRGRIFSGYVGLRDCSPTFQRPQILSIWQALFNFWRLADFDPWTLKKTCWVKSQTSPSFRFFEINIRSAWGFFYVPGRDEVILIVIIESKLPKRSPTQDFGQVSWVNGNLPGVYKIAWGHHGTLGMPTSKKEGRWNLQTKSKMWCFNIW